MKNEKTQLEKYLNERLASSTIDSYLYIINRFLNNYPKASKLKLVTIEGYCMKLKDNGASVRYRGVVIAAIKAYYDFLLDAGVIKEHPCPYMKTETKPTGTNFNNFLTMPEMLLLLKLKQERYPVLINRDRAIIGLLIYQGISGAELVGLRVGDIDFDNGTVYIKASRRYRSRTLSLQPNQVPVLLGYINQDRHKLAAKSDKLLISMRGVPMTVDSIHALINRMAGAFDKEVSPSNIRKSVINYWLNERKFSLEDVQIMFGHKYPSATEKYLQNDTEEQRGVVSDLHQMIFSN